MDSMRDDSTDTIAAIATAPGAGAIGIVRVSGPLAFEIADAVTRPKKSVNAQPPRTLKRSVIYDLETGEIIDDGLLATFVAPHSFTGEHVIEFQGHGGPVVLKRVFAAFLAAGARTARPGEFSERAFVNGKLDLAQAEAIADMIAAGTVAAQRIARRQLNGELSFAVKKAARAIQEALMFVEASIDFPEEVGDLNVVAVDTALSTAQEIIERLVDTAAYGRRIRDGITLVLTGRPNVGKSSLLNTLSGTERAIVTPIPGTTRDIVEETLILHGIPVRALDTAGIRETNDPVEIIGVERARTAVENADVVVAILDSNVGATFEDYASLDVLASNRLVIVVNKSDIADAEPLCALLRMRYDPISIIAVSATTGSGLAELIDEIVAVATKGEAWEGIDPLVTSARHEAALFSAKDANYCAQVTLRLGLPAELIAVDAHAALASLGEITGETAREDILKSIFARFCIGK